MSLYNMVHRVQVAAFFVWPFVGDGLHPDALPRFRDVFAFHPDLPEFTTGHIILVTRTGGGNRADYAAENDALRALPGFVRDDDGVFRPEEDLPRFDDTFALWTYEVPQAFRADYEHFVAGRRDAYSLAAQERCRAVYPKLRPVFDKMWPETIPTE